MLHNAIYTKFKNSSTTPNNGYEVEAGHLFIGKVHRGPFFSDGNMYLYLGGGYAGRNYLRNGDCICRNSPNCALQNWPSFYVNYTSAKNKVSQVHQENEKPFKAASPYFPNWFQFQDLCLIVKVLHHLGFRDQLSLVSLCNLYPMENHHDLGSYHSTSLHFPPSFFSISHTLQVKH